MVFGYDLLCGLLEMLNLINIGSAVATRRNLVNPNQLTNMRGLMGSPMHTNIMYICACIDLWISAEALLRLRRVFFLA
jgi:hypothetical protein